MVCVCVCSPLNYEILSYVRLVDTTNMKTVCLQRLCVIFEPSNAYRHQQTHTHRQTIDISLSQSRSNIPQRIPQYLRGFIITKLKKFSLINWGEIMKWGEKWIYVRRRMSSGSKYTQRGVFWFSDYFWKDFGFMKVFLFWNTFLKMLRVIIQGKYGPDPLK